MEFLKNGIVYITMPSIINARYFYKLKIQLDSYFRNKDLKNNVSYFIFDLSKTEDITAHARELVTNNISKWDFFGGGFFIKPNDNIYAFLSILSLLYPAIRLRVVENKEDAITKINFSKQGHISGRKIIKEWNYIASSKEYSYQVLLLEDEIFISRPSGIITEKDSKSANKFFKKILKETGIKKYYRLQDYRDVLSVTLGARKDFAKWIKANIQHMHLLIFFEVNKTIEDAIRFEKMIFDKFNQISVVENREQAFELVEIHQKGEWSTVKNTEFIIPSSVKEKDALINKMYDENIKLRIKYNQDLRNIFEKIGRVSWDTSLVIDKPEIHDTESRRDLHKALSMVSNDLKRLLSKKEEQDIRLKETENQFLFLTESLPIAIYAFSLEGKIKYWNKAAEDYFAVSKTDILNKNIFEEEIFLEQQTRIKKIINRAAQLNMEGKFYPIYEYKLKRKDGETLDFQTICVLVRKETEAIVFKIDIDITSQKRVEEELLEHQNSLEKIVEQKVQEIAQKDKQSEDIMKKLDQMVLVLKKHKILYINPFGESFLGYTQEEISHIPFYQLIHQEEREDYLFRYKKKIDSTLVSILRLVDKKGKEKWVQISSVNIMWKGEEAVLKLLVDITARREVENNLIAAKEKLEEAALLKSVFLANMSHEIRTPLNAIIGFSQLLAEEEVDASMRKEYINMINTNSNQLLNLIADIIDLAKIESGQVTINETVFNLNEFIKELNINYKELIKGVGKDDLLILKIKLPIKSEDIFVKTDKNRLKQVFDNLVNNALKFTKKGKITIGYKIINPLNKVEFFVKDTGIGIQKSKQEFIFNRFHQLKMSAHTKAKGAGLGLAISKDIIELMGGEIAVESEFGKGATFLFSIPYKSEFNTNLQKPKKANRNIPTVLDWRDKTILLAEDEESNYIFIREILKRTKAQLIWVENGKEAIEVVKNEEDIDLILLDIQMPVMNGYETITALKEMGVDIPIIAQTAYAMVEDRNKIEALGFDAYISKPIQVNILFDTLRQFIIT